MPETQAIHPAGAANRYTYRIASVAALGGLLFGFDTAIINGAIVFLRRQFVWSDFETEIAASSLLVGCVAGAGFAGALSDRYGRRRMLLAAAGIFALSSVAAALPNSLAEFAAARTIAGAAIGVASMLAPLYIAEVSPESIRGRLVSLNQLAIMLGILLSYVAGWLLAGLGDASWRWMFASAAAPSLLFFAALFTVPESPRWLVAVNREADARGILSRLNQPASRVDTIREAIAEEKDVNLRDRSLRKPLLIGVALAILQQVTGINTILYYGSIIFTEQAGALSASSALWANVIIGVVNLLCTVIALAVIDRIGRKALLMFASAGMGVSLTLLGVLLSMPGMASGLILTLVLCYVGCFSVGLGPGVWVVISELFPTRVRGRAMSVATISLWMACLAITSSFLSVVRAISIVGAFGTYAALCLLTFLFVWRCVPETKGRSLEEIERQWTK
ncbi:MAG TPA: sugar porter family MFS transporter [Bryobacteraceae bacterium]|jgi:sugar porter (SP) family MFS transporter|nr:sugar porter family MFS transporter [Bryobacteraceae bacterium]